ncbi:MAG: acetate--CoA ligase family protein [Proteobacteria bacterium]|nr:acetate--CoA ligase family protein [Burkholderiales bacterium]
MIEPDLTRLFAPRSVALVGATDHPSNFGGRVFRAMLNFGYLGKIYPVNTRLKDIYGLTCFPSIDDVPETPDHVGIIVSVERVFDVLAQCAARGVPFVTVYTAGFAETATAEGCARQARLVAIARASGMRIMGPNCNGVINFVDGFAMTSTGAIGGPRRPAGNVGVVSHSGGLGQITVMWRAQMSGLGVSYEASCGNEADLDTLDFARFMLRSPCTDIVLMAIESFKDGAKLEAVAREALEREKPIVVLKLGRTAAGSRAAASHTGAIAGVDDIYEAAFRQYGMLRVNTCNELYETAILLRNRRWPTGRRVASVAATGGNIVHVADMGADQGLSWPEYTPQTQAVLGGLLPGYGSSILNPSDLTSLATGEPAMFARALEAIADDPNIDAIAPLFSFVSRSQIEAGAEFIRACRKPAAMIWIGGCTDDAHPTADELVASGIPVYRDALPCLRSIRAAADFGERVEIRRQGKDIAQRPAGIAIESARARIATVSGWLGEREAKQVLAEYGFPVTREGLARSADEAVRHAAQLGVRVALKIDSPDIVHKTDAGAVRLDLDTGDHVRQAFDDIMQAATRARPDAHLNGVLVQEMVPRGVEMILGVVRDPVFGPVVAVGFGGIHVEVLRDIRYRIAPTTVDEARAMLAELRGAKLLDGVRGTPPRDIECLCDLIVRLSWFAHDLREQVVEVDINPLVVFERGAGARVVDALIVVAQRADGPQVAQPTRDGRAAPPPGAST